jgi:hypothetical protein
MKKIVVLLLLFALVSCKSTRPIISTSNKSVLIERRVDTILYTLPDSASIVALLRCDSLGNAYLSEIERLSIGRSIKPSILVRDNRAIFECRVDSMAVYLSISRRMEANVDTTYKVENYRPQTTGFRSTTKSLIFIFLIGGILGAFVLRAIWRIR